MTEPNEPTRAQARRQKKRAAILAIARDAFFRDGYAGTSMSEIAARVGGSKGTLYGYFGSKFELFSAVLRDFLASHEAEITGIIQEGGPPEDVVRAFAFRFLEVLTRPETLALIRLINAESGRFPEVGQAFFESGPRAAQEKLIAYIQGAIDQGYLKPETDAVVAARQLIVLSQGWIYHMRVWNVGPPPGREECEQAAEDTLATFMAAYGV